MMNVVLPTETQKTISYYHLGTAEPPCILTRIGHMHQTQLKKGVWHANVCYHTLIVYQVCCDVRRCVKSGSCFLLSLKWKVNGQHRWDILPSQQMLAVIKHAVDDNIICLSAIGLHLLHAPVHSVCNTVQQLLCIVQFSWAVSPTRQN